MRTVVDEMHAQACQQCNIRQRREGVHAMIAQDDAEQNRSEQEVGAAQSPVHVTPIARVAEEWLRGC